MDYIDGMKLKAFRLDDDFYDARPRVNCDGFDEFGRAAMADFVKRMMKPDLSIDRPAGSLIAQGLADRGKETKRE